MWPIIKKAVNSDLSTPLNTLINNVKSIVNNVNSIVNTVNTNVGSNADAASSTGSLHAKIKSLDSGGVMLHRSIASNQLKLSHDTEVLKMGQEWSKEKSILVMISGTIRVSFDLAGGYPGGYPSTGFGKIYKNGVSIGIERTVQGRYNDPSPYTTFTEDILCFDGDTIEFWLRSSSSNSTEPGAKAKNFRIYFDVNTTPIYGMVL